MWHTDCRGAEIVILDNNNNNNLFDHFRMIYMDIERGGSVSSQESYNTSYYRNGLQSVQPQDDQHHEVGRAGAGP